MGFTLFSKSQPTDQMNKATNGKGQKGQLPQGSAAWQTLGRSLFQKGRSHTTMGTASQPQDGPLDYLSVLGITLKIPFILQLYSGERFIVTQIPFSSCLNFLHADAYNHLALTGFPSCCFSLAVVRSHACEVDPYGMPGGCSHICLLSSNYKARTCRCRTGFILGSDGRSCKSMLFKSKSLPAASISGYRSGCYLTRLSRTIEITWAAFG